MKPLSYVPSHGKLEDQFSIMLERLQNEQLCESGEYLRGTYYRWSLTNTSSQLMEWCEYFTMREGCVSNVMILRLRRRSKKISEWCDEMQTVKAGISSGCSTCCFGIRCRPVEASREQDEMHPFRWDKTGIAVSHVWNREIRITTARRSCQIRSQEQPAKNSDEVKQTTRILSTSSTPCCFMTSNAFRTSVVAKTNARSTRERECYNRSTYLYRVCENLCWRSASLYTLDLQDVCACFACTR
jgi:hypothetical protein